MKTANQISVVIPIYNEAQALPLLIEQLEGVLKKNFKSFELIPVNDGSTDDTGEYLNTLAKKKNYNALAFSKNQGQSAAIHYGVCSASHPLVVTMDADGQNDPEDIPALVAKYQKGRAVCGVRTGRKDYLLRRFFSFCARRALNVAGGFRARDPGCTLKVFAKEDFMHLPHFRGMHRFIPYLFHNIGVEVLQVEVRHHPRRGGKSKYRLWSRTFRVFFDIFGLFWLRKRTMKYFNYIKKG